VMGAVDWRGHLHPLGRHDLFGRALSFGSAVSFRVCCMGVIRDEPYLILSPSSN
jgi:hypothetical protein